MTQLSLSPMLVFDVEQSKFSGAGADKANTFLKRHASTFPSTVGGGNAAPQPLASVCRNGAMQSPFGSASS